MKFEDVHEEFNTLLAESKVERFAPGARPSVSDLWNMATLLVIERSRKLSESSTE